MEKLIKELRSIIQFKDTTDCGDIVLIAAKEPEMLFYAYVSDIQRDTTRRDEWWNIELQVLSIPPQKMTWTLRTAQMTGMETFTMGGDARFFKAVDFSSPKKVIPVPEKKESEEKVKKSFIKRIK